MMDMADRRDPFGNLLPRRLHWSDGSYYHVVRRHGKPKWSRLSRNYADALQQWARLEGTMQHARTVIDMVEAYIIERGPEIAPKTIKGYQSSAKRIAAWAGPLYLDEILRTDVRAWLRANSAPVSANRDHALLKAAYNYAVECGWCTNNPASGVKRRREQPRRRIATPAELGRLSEKATPMWRAILAVQLLTGMRESEQRLLMRDALTGDGILLFRPKTGAESLIEWTSALRDGIEAALSAHRVGSVYVFPSMRGGPYSEDGFRTIWYRLCKRASVEGLQFRDMRRTAGTAAETLEHARDLLGHTSTAITRRVYRPRNRVKPTA